MHSKISPKRVWRHSLKKVASRALPETSPYASRTVPAMVFTLPKRCLQAPFCLHFGSISEPFGHLGRPKVTQGAKKTPPKKKNIKKRLQKRCPKVSKMTSKMGCHFFLWAPFLPTWSHLRPNGSREPILAPFFIETQ